MKSKSFFEVLEDQIRKEVRSEMARNGLRQQAAPYSQHATSISTSTSASFSSGAFGALGPLPTYEFSMAELYSQIPKSNLATKSIPAGYRHAKLNPSDKSTVKPFETAGSDRPPRAAATSEALDKKVDSGIDTGIDSASAMTNEPSQETFVCRTAEQWIAFHLLNKNGIEIKVEFTRDDLKTASRKIALRFHPDRNWGLSTDSQKQTTETFLQLRSSLEQLLPQSFR